MGHPGEHDAFVLRTMLEHLSECEDRFGPVWGRWLTVVGADGRARPTEALDEVGTWEAFDRAQGLLDYAEEVSDATLFMWEDAHKVREGPKPKGG